MLSCYSTLESSLPTYCLWAVCCADDETDSIEEQIKDLACLDLSAQRQHTAALCQLSDNGVGAGCQALQVSSRRT